MRKLNTGLSHTLRETGLTKDSEWIFFNHPNLERISYRLADFALDILPGKTGRPLFMECIESAFAAYARVATAKGVRYGAGILNDRIHAELTSAYCIGLITPMGVVNNIKVYVEVQNGQHTVWEMFVESLSEFVARHKTPPKVVQDSWHVSEGAVRTLVASRIMDMRDAALVDSFEDMLFSLGSHNKSIQHTTV